MVCSDGVALVAVAAVVLAASAAGCASPGQGESAESSDSALVEHDEAGLDAQVLQVWTPGRVFPGARQGATASDVSFDADTQCATLEARSWLTWQARVVDCAAALAAAAPYDLTGTPGPLLTPVLFSVTKDLAAGKLEVDPDSCSRIELRLVVREAAVAQPSFAGVGFWTSRGDRFTPKGALQEVSRARLVNGDPAVVYRFTGVSTCLSSESAASSQPFYQTFSFKPYAAYDATPGGGSEAHRYRVWERVPFNHTLGRSAPGDQPLVDRTSFDRQGELLAP
jgi:hypothetical protein